MTGPTLEQTFLLGNGKRIRLCEGDITRVPADAIVNAANAQLLGGGGVDGAIHRAGGPTLMQELDNLRPMVAPLPPGAAVATTAGRLPARFVFHTAGPVYRGGRRGEADALAACYTTCMRMAEEQSLTTISFPAISTGVYGFPAEQAGQIAIQAVRQFLLSEARSLECVVFVQFGHASYDLYRRLLEESFPAAAAQAF